MIEELDNMTAYRAVGELRAGYSQRAIDWAGNEVVLKRLDPACIQHGRLHPNVRERLSRIRELPLRDVAVLHGVVRLDREAVLVWDYLPGQTLAEAASKSDLQMLARDVTLLVESLHAHGIVHGALHAGNIIVNSVSQPRLTHFSPLLHYDMEIDKVDLAATLRAIGAAEVPPSLTFSQASNRSVFLDMITHRSFWTAVVLCAVAVAAGMWIYRVERQAITPATLIDAR